MSGVDRPGLDALLRWFHAVITTPDGVGAGAESVAATAALPGAALDELVTAHGDRTASDRLSVYANAYFARLIECLGESFPVLQRALGDEAFAGLAADYLVAHPSSTKHKPVWRGLLRTAVYGNRSQPD